MNRSAVWKLLRSLVGDTATVDTKTYEQLVEILKDHYNPKPSIIVERFNSRIQAPGESVAKYIAALRAVVEYYDYGNCLDDMLRDRINHDKIQQCLLAEKTLDYKSAVDLAKSIKVAEQGSRDIKNGNGSGGLPHIHYAGGKRHWTRQLKEEKAPK